MKKKLVASIGAAFLGAAMLTAPLPGSRNEKQMSLGSNAPVSLLDVIKSAFAPTAPSPDMNWVDSRGMATADAWAVLGVLRDSGTHGLNPSSYKIDEIEKLMNDPSQTGRLNRLMTKALVDYAQDMTGPRIDTAFARSRPEYWRTPLSEAEVRSVFSNTPDMKASLRALEPAAPLYGTLRKELARLVSLPPEPGGANKIVMSGLLFPGQGHKAVPSLRARLGLPAKTGSAATAYDSEMVAAVKKFQQDHNLDPDGIIGPAVIEQMNFTNADRIVQVVANLERLRWDLPRPDRYIEVNIATQTLRAVDGGKLAHEIDIIAGRAARQTREFHTVITGTRFNPTWNVPSGIMNRDKIPELQKNPYALEEKEIYVYYDGKRIDPGTIDWKNITDEQLKHIKLKQTPGAHNALGHVRVLMDNRYDQYLHYTNQPELFDKTQRTLSSGCMRMKEPDKIVGFLMGMTQADIDKYKNGTATNVNVRAQKQTDFFSVYRTTAPAANGTMKYYPDVYNRDKNIYDALQKSGQLPPEIVFVKSAPPPPAPLPPKAP